jgi:hypothetical protein
MLFHPINNTINSNKEYLGLRNIQKKIAAISNISKRGKIKPSQEINHHRMGLRYGARQASKKTATSIKFRTIKNLKKKVRTRVTITAIYPINGQRSIVSR